MSVCVCVCVCVCASACECVFLLNINLKKLYLSKISAVKKRILSLLYLSYIVSACSDR